MKGKLNVVQVPQGLAKLSDHRRMRQEGNRHRGIQRNLKFKSSNLKFKI
jgi:hypothetical protein